MPSIAAISSAHALRLLEPEKVSAIIRLNGLGWDARRISRELGISRNTVKSYIAAGGWTAYQQPERKKALDGLETWLRERLPQHRGNAARLRVIAVIDFDAQTHGIGHGT